MKEDKMVDDLFCAVATGALSGAELPLRLDAETSSPPESRQCTSHTEPTVYSGNATRTTPMPIARKP